VSQAPRTAVKNALVLVRRASTVTERQPTLTALLDAILGVSRTHVKGEPIITGECQGLRRRFNGKGQVGTGRRNQW
jgi:hypothetical protein